MYTQAGKLAYSSCNEDANSEIVALRIKPEDTILCITGSGARVLDLLTQSPKKIIAIDFNRTQQYLLKLKAVAIKSLEYCQFCQFIGLSSCDTRRDTYHQLRTFLNSEEQVFWDNHLHLIEKGILFQGQWELYFQKNAKFTQLLRATKQKKLFTIDNLSEQISFWEAEWANGLWRLLLKLCSNRLVWYCFLRDPGFYAYVPKSFNIYQYIKERFDNASRHFLLNRSHFAQLLFWGKWNNLYLPPHLKKANYATLKTNIDSIVYCNMNLLSGIKSLPIKSVDKFSLSDFSSYTSATDYQMIWELIPSIAKPGAIVCERQFLVKRLVSNTEHIKRDTVLEHQLTSTDQSIFYTFVIANILNDTGTSP